MALGGLVLWLLAGAASPDELGATEMLEPLVGRNNVKAQVSAEIDFSQVESTSEQHRPNQGADAVATVRSQQTVEDGAAGKTEKVKATGK